MVVIRMFVWRWSKCWKRGVVIKGMLMCHNVINSKLKNNLMAHIASDITDGSVRLPSGHCVDVNVMFCVDRGWF